jgi:hypothetical protein
MPVLDCHAETVLTLDEIEQLPRSVVLPALWEGGFEQKGIAPGLPGCKRRFPRIRCRGKRSLIALERRQTLPALPRTHAWFSAYVTDIGRTGVGLLHGEPFYPKERMRILLPNGTPRLVEVVRCERFDERCFGIGVKFV